MSERSLTARILKDLKVRDDWAFKVQGGSWQRRGVVDILVCSRGLFGAIEVKTVGGKLTKLQEREINVIQRSGGITAVVETWEEYQQFLRYVQRFKVVEDAWIN